MAKYPRSGMVFRGDSGDMLAPSSEAKNVSGYCLEKIWVFIAEYCIEYFCSS